MDGGQGASRLTPLSGLGTPARGSLERSGSGAAGAGLPGKATMQPPGPSSPRGAARAEHAVQGEAKTLC